MLKGMEVDFGGGTKLVVPPMSLGAVERFGDKLAAPSGKDLIDMLHSALGRNYPAMTRDEVAELVDIENAARVTDALMNVSRLTPPEGEAAPNKARRTGGASTRT